MTMSALLGLTTLMQIYKKFLVTNKFFLLIQKKFLHLGLRAIVDVQVYFHIYPWGNAVFGKLPHLPFIYIGRGWDIVVIGEPEWVSA